MFRSPDAGPNFRLGTLRLLAGDGWRKLWSRVGDHGDVWHRGERVRVNAQSFAFEYIMADGYSQPALAEVVVECDFAPPPHPPQAPPTIPSPLPPPFPLSPPMPPRPEASEVELDGLWIAIILAGFWVLIKYHEKYLFEVETPRTLQKDVPWTQL